MYNQTRTNQGGSVVSFLIVGVVLAVVTLGGVYLLQQRNQGGELAQSPSPNPTTSAPAGGASTSPSASPSATSKPSSSVSPVPSSHPTTGTAPSGNLPATGPVDNFLATVMPGALLVAATAGYLRSHKARFGTFRR